MGLRVRLRGTLLSLDFAGLLRDDVLGSFNKWSLCSESRSYRPCHFDDPLGRPDSPSSGGIPRPICHIRQHHTYSADVIYTDAPCIQSPRWV